MSYLPGSGGIASGGCVIISIEGLQRRRFKKVDWTKLMPDVSVSRSSLSLLRSPGNRLDLVLTRNYGATIAVILDENSAEENALMRIPSEHSAEFLELYCDDVLAPELTEQYDKIQLYLVEHGHDAIGLLTSARAALMMKNQGLEPGEAVERARQQGITLAHENGERTKQTDTVLDAN